MSLTPFPHDSPCPCGGGLPVAKCSCKGANFVPPAILCQPKPPATEFRLMGCYAESLGDCQRPLTNEHPLSSTVLQLLTGNGNSVGVSNHNWQRDKKMIQHVGVGSLTTRVLCRRHNGALSPLDTFARKFIVAQMAQMEHVRSGLPVANHWLFNGQNLEKWMLKVLCGIIAGGYAPGSDSAIDWTPPTSWLNLIFGADKFPSGCGLYRPRGPKYPLATKSIYVKPLYRRDFDPTDSGILLPPPFAFGSLYGVSITIFGVTYILSMIPLNRPGAPSRNWLYRPRMLRLYKPSEPSREGIIHLAWEETRPNFRGNRNSIEFSSVPDDVLDENRSRLDRAQQKRRKRGNHAQGQVGMTCGARLHEGGSDRRGLESDVSPIPRWGPASDKRGRTISRRLFPDTRPATQCGRKRWSRVAMATAAAPRTPAEVAAVRTTAYGRPAAQAAKE